MKKTILTTFIALALGGTMTAQTNFRNLEFKKAVATAQQENKMLFIDFYTDWCGPCRKMIREVFPQKSVGDFMNKNFVSIKMNAEKEGKALAQQFGVNAFPTFIGVNGKEEVIFTIKGAYDPQDFITKVSSSMDPEMAPGRIEARYKAGERTPKVVNNYALAKMMAGNETEGFKIVNDYFDSLTDAQRLQADNAFLFTRYTLSLDDYKAKFMVDHRNEFDPSVKEDINKRVAQMYHSSVTAYLSGYLTMEKEFNEATYQALKKKITDLGLNNDHSYDAPFRLIEARVKQDDATYMETIKKEFDHLSEGSQSVIIMNFPRLLPTEDKAVLKEMSSFIRGRLSTLSANTITLTGRILDVIERKL